MAQRIENAVVEYLRQVASDEPSDVELLARFGGANDGEAFALLLRRHGPMVLGVCRRGAGEWAEDAFQATFLALARAPRRVTESLPGWLHRVATRVSQRCSRRRTQSLPTEPIDASDRFATVEWRELRAALDEELASLPASLRAPLVLCYLDGLTRDEAAARLDCSLRTLHRRLNEGRRRLRARLTRRGLAPVLLGASVLSADGLRAAVPGTLMQQTVDRATGAIPISPSVDELLAGAAGVRTMLMKPLIVLAVLAGGIAAAVAARHPAAATAEPPKTPMVELKPKAAPPKLVPGKWALFESPGPGNPQQQAVLTIGEKDGKPVITAIEDDTFEWTVKDLSVSDRRVRFLMTRSGPIDYQFDGLFDTADPTRVLGSLMTPDSSSADLAVLELVRPGRAARRPELPADFRKLVEIVGEFNQMLETERSARERADMSPEEALKVAQEAARAKYGAQERTVLRKMANEQSDNAYGHYAVQQLLFSVEFTKPPIKEVESWAKLVRPFAARHGPQFKAATLGRFATSLIRFAEYAPLAHQFAVEADKLAAEPQFEKRVAEWDEERRAWATQPKLPAADAVWTVTVTGKVTDAKGEAIAGAEVQVNNMQWVKVLWSDGSNKTKTGPDGRYTITLKCQGMVRAHVTKMWAETPGLVRTYDTERHKLLPGQSATVDFVLNSGEPFGGTLKIRQDPGERNSQQLLVLKGPGVYEHVLVRNGEKFTHILPPGTYTVELHRGRNNLTWSGLKTGTTDHVLEEPKFEFNSASVGAGFDEMWKSMDRNYSYFSIKPDIDWAKLRDEYRPKAIKAKSAEELAKVLAEMLGRLKDGHIWIMTPDGEQIGTHRTQWSYNGNRKSVLDQLTEITECGQFAVVGKTKPDGFGYFLMTRQSSATLESMKKAVAAIEKLAGAPGFIIDLRNANGGNELFAREVAQHFCEKKVVYAKSKFRNGSRHDDFDNDHPRELPAAKSGKPYLKPLVCLLGPGCVSSGEGFAQMMVALPHVTAVGLPTRGSSGNPAPVDVGDTGLKVYFSRWVDMMPDGTPIEGKGVPVKVRVDVAADAYKDADPTLAKALEILRKKQ
jgi:RNA polymerase sigma factor (sigma-70 family)